MPAYNRGQASLESYLVKILAALCRANNGEIRIRGELIDQIDQPVTLLKDWDSRKQELVLRTHMGAFGEVFRAIPEKQPTREVIAVDRSEQEKEIPFDSIRHKNVGLDDQKLSEMERTLMKRRIAGMINDEMKQKRRQAQEA